VTKVKFVKFPPPEHEFTRHKSFLLESGAFACKLLADIIPVDMSGLDDIEEVTGHVVFPEVGRCQHESFRLWVNNRLST
jgi:hypothetical protein